MLLYRGDKTRPASDVIHHVLLAGLFARYGDGGSSALLRRPGGIVEYVLAHVGWKDGTEEARFARNSPMISFTADPHVAHRYMVSLRDIEVDPCPLRQSEFLLFTLDVDWEALRPTSFAGVRVLEYRRSHENCRDHVATSVANGSITDDIALFAVEEVVRTQDSGPHFAGVVNVVEFLQHHREAFFAEYRETATELYPTALSRATRDREWLLYPADPLGDDPIAPSALFHPNRHLAVEGYRGAVR